MAGMNIITRSQRKRKKISKDDGDTEEEEDSGKEESPTELEERDDEEKEQDEEISDIFERFENLPKSAQIDQQRVKSIMNDIRKYVEKKQNEIEELKEKHQSMFGQLDEILFDADITILAKGRNQIPAVKRHLMQKSEVFSAMFKYEMIEKETSTINLEDYHPTAVKHLIKFCAIGNQYQIKSCSDEVYLDVLAMAGIFQVPKILNSVKIPSDPTADLCINAFSAASLQYSQQDDISEWKNLYSNLCSLLRKNIRQVVKNEYFCFLSLKNLHDVLSQGIDSHSNSMDSPKILNQVTRKTFIFNLKSLCDQKYTIECSDFLDEAVFEVSLLSESESNAQHFCFKLISQPNFGEVAVKDKEFKFKISSSNPAFRKWFKNDKIEKTFRHPIAFSKSRTLKVFMGGSFWKSLEGQQEDWQMVDLDISIKECFSKLDIICIWATKRMQRHENWKPFSLVEIWAYIDSLEDTSREGIEFMKGDFVSLFACSFENTFLNNPSLSMLSREMFAEVICQHKLAVCSEFAVLQALLSWAKIPDELIRENELMKNLIASSSERFLVSVHNEKTGSVEYGKVLQLNFDSDLVPRSVVVTFSEDCSFKEVHSFGQNVKLYRDVTKLLPLVRFPFISLDDIGKMKKSDRKFLQYFKVARELQNEALALQLAHTEKAQEEIHTLKHPLVENLIHDMNNRRKKPRLSFKFKPQTIPAIPWDRQLNIQL